MIDVSKFLYIHIYIYIWSPLALRPASPCSHSSVIADVLSSKLVPIIATLFYLIRNPVKLSRNFIDRTARFGANCSV